MSPVRPDNAQNRAGKLLPILSFVSSVVSILSFVAVFVDVAPIVRLRPAIVRLIVLILAYVAGGATIFMLGILVGKRSGSRKRTTGNETAAQLAPGSPVAEYWRIVEMLTPLLDHYIDYSFRVVFDAIGLGNEWYPQLRERICEIHDDFYILLKRKGQVTDWRALSDHLAVIVRRLERASADLAKHRDDWKPEWRDSNVEKLVQQYDFFANKLEEFHRVMRYGGPCTHPMRALLKLNGR